MHTIQNNNDYLELVISGEFDNNGLYQAFREMLLHPDYPHKKSLWVFDRCDCAFSGSAMYDLIGLLKSVYPLNATRTKTAFLGSNSTQYAFGELWREEAERAGLSFAIKVFRSRDDAEAWLKDK